jgi:predicted N-acetyltransferase YhbS
LILPGKQIFLKQHVLKENAVMEQLSIEEAAASEMKLVEFLIKSSKLSSEYLSEAERTLIARENGKAVGCLALEKMGKKVYLQSLAVIKEKRRQGIGRALINIAFDGYVNKGEIVIALTLFWNNKFYRTLGFRKLNARKVKKADEIAGRAKHKYCVAFGKIKK